MLPGREGATMSIFVSQFDRARVYTGIYTGPPDDPTWRTPRGAASGGFLAVGAVAAVAAGGIVAGLAVAAAIDAFFDGDAGPGPHPDSHQAPHPDAMAHAHAGPDSVPAHEASGVGPASSGATDAGGADAGGHANAWGTGWGQGWDHGWDAESSHRLAAGGHVDAAASGHAADGLGQASDQAAHQLSAMVTGPDSAHDGPHQAEPGSAAAHAGPAHLQLSGTESPGYDGSGHDGSDAVSHEGYGFGYHGDADHHLHTGHEDAWAHDMGHADAAFDGHDGGLSSFHDGAS
jgi:hypothetical protein